MARSNPDHLAAWLTFIGAISVALIAAITAHWRLHVTNKAEQARLDARLADGNKQHLDQLAHERKLKDREELRQVLDDAAAEIPGLVELAANLAILAIEGLAAWSASGDPQRSSEHFLRGIAQKERLAVRLGRQHEITNAYDRLLDSILDSYQQCRDQTVRNAGATPEARDERDELIAEIEKYSDAFADCAFRAAGTEV